MHVAWSRKARDPLTFPGDRTPKRLALARQMSFTNHPEAMESPDQTA